MTMLRCGVKPLQLNPRVGSGELPVRLGVFLVAVVLSGGDFFGQRLLVGDAESLGGQHAEL
jgi:hypothetical protein